MRIFFILLMACGLMASLTACAIPDLVAHTVKEVEKSRRGDSSAQASNASTRPASSSASVSEAEEPPPPRTAPAPRKSTVTAEELPPQ